MTIGKNVDWVTLRAQWEAGTPVAKLVAEHGISSSRIHQVKKRDQWTPMSRKAKGELVAASSPNGDAQAETGIKHIGKGRSIGQPMGEIGADTEALSKFGALAGLSAPEEAAVIRQAGTEIELMRQHRAIISRASVVAEHILTRLHALVVEGHAADVITFTTKAGGAHHRVAFLGDRESVSDALLKCANAISKLVPLERQAHGLQDADKSAELPRVVFNMPGVRVISVDGKGKVVRAEDRPALIDGQAQDAGEAEGSEQGASPAQHRA